MGTATDFGWAERTETVKYFYLLERCKLCLLFSFFHFTDYMAELLSMALLMFKRIPAWWNSCDSGGVVYFRGDCEQFMVINRMADQNFECEIMVYHSSINYFI